VVSTGWFRRQQQKDEIDRLIIHRIEIYWLVQTGKKPNDLIKILVFAVGDGNAMTDPCRPKPLACQQFVEDIMGFCCKACFLLLAFKEAITPFGLIKSERSILSKT
jgi:hypothetical protein